MEKNKKNEELQSRREFFKKAAKGALPILALSVLGPSVLVSCEKLEDEKKKSSDGCGNTCKGSCSKGCGGKCQQDCGGTCDSTCEGTCYTRAW